jgi:hypothetical protein
MHKWKEIRRVYVFCKILVTRYPRAMAVARRKHTVISS